LKLGMVVALASIEAFAGVCVGCAIHSLLVRGGLLRAPVCEDCASIRIPTRDARRFRGA
jgi:hypothetical protein